ncbi:MAG: 3-keto-5-aminohexanoate cleavage protein [Deltaproteobacteria bacterium]|nr:3-keto-5-aminohexanoate cleavage protein [Deltaproteobacteria bacterium]
MEKVIITAALVGAELTREQTPYLPLTPDEIAEAARLSAEAGAAVLHIHVRDDQGRPTNSAGRFQEVLREIREKCRPCPLLMVSTGGAVGDSFQSRAEPLEAGPEIASLNAGSVNFGDEVFSNPLPFIEFLAKRELEKGIKPEIEVYDLSHIETAIQLIEKGFIKKPAQFQLVMGVKGGIAATEENLRLFVSRLPAGSSWTVAGIGRNEFPMAELAIKLGGNVRVGLEDNIYLEKGVLAKGSHELVKRVVELADRYHREVASIEEARKILCLA